MTGPSAKRLASRRTFPVREFGLAVVVVVLAVSAARPNYSDTAATVISVTSLLLVAIALSRRWWSHSPKPQTVGMVRGVVPLEFLVVGYPIAIYAGGGTSVLTWSRVALAVLVISYGLVPIRGARLWMVTRVTIVAAVVIAIGTWVIETFPEPPIDVFQLHVAGADALALGANPYVEAVAPDTSSIADPGDTVPYPYPPLTALLFSAATWVGGDPRWASIVAMAVAAVMLATQVPQGGRPAAIAGGVVAVAFVAQVGWPTIVRFAWTEPVSLPFLFGGALLWRHRPIGSGVLLGLAFATKQYFLLGIPLLLFAADQDRYRRTLAAGVTASLAVLPAFAWNWSAAWSSMVGAFVNLPPRPDSANLAGLGIEVPSMLGLAMATVVAVALARVTTSGSGFLLGLAATLGVLFLLGFQSFGNYLFLIASLVLASLILTGSETPDAPSHDMRTHNSVET